MTADRLADAAPDAGPALSGDEATALSESAPSDAALAAIAAEQEREARRLWTQRFRL